MRVAAARLVAGLALLVGGAAAFAQAQPPADQIIVKWRDGSSASGAVIVVPTIMSKCLGLNSPKGPMRNME